MVDLSLSPIRGRGSAATGGTRTYGGTVVFWLALWRGRGGGEGERGARGEGLPFISRGTTRREFFLSPADNFYEILGPYGDRAGNSTPSPSPPLSLPVPVFSICTYKINSKNSLRSSFSQPLGSSWARLADHPPPSRTKWSWVEGPVRSVQATSDAEAGEKPLEVEAP